MSKAGTFQEFHDENSQRSTTHLAPGSQTDTQESLPPVEAPDEAGRTPEQARRLKRFQCMLMGACTLLWLFIILVIIIYGTRTRCDTAKGVADEAIIVEAYDNNNLPYTVVLYVQNWYVQEECYKGWSSVPKTKPKYTIGTVGLYKWNGTAITNYTQLYQKKYDQRFGAFFGMGAVAQEHGYLHFVLSLQDTDYVTLFTYDLAAGRLTTRNIFALQWGFITFGLDTDQPYLYYLDVAHEGHMQYLDGSNPPTYTWHFTDNQLLFPEASGYYNGSRLIANAVNFSTSSPKEVDYDILDAGIATLFPAPWASALAPALGNPIAVYFDTTDDANVMIGPIADPLTGKRPGNSCSWYRNGVTTPASALWEMQLCDGAIFEAIAGGYSLVDIVNQRVIIIPQLNDWDIVAVTWIAQDQYQTQLWFDPSRDNRPTTTRPFVLVSKANPQGVYLPGYFPEKI